MATHRPKKRKQEPNEDPVLEFDEEGKEINPHVPQYMSQAPWYMDSNRPSMRHQKKLTKEPEKPSLDQWYPRGMKASKAATKFRKGACQNCGAMSHKTKECMERPRKKGARWTGSNIKEDELILDPNIEDFEAKRDRWNGYDPEMQKIQIEEFEKLEEERRKIREKAVAEKLANQKPESIKQDLDALSDSDEVEDDEEKYADQADMPGQKVDMVGRTTVRNLRIREDTAKYLLNLKPDSAFYDPKTRSMRENPDTKQTQFPGENFYLYTGEHRDMAKMQKFAWDAYEKGVDVNLQADPTRASLLRKEYEKKRENVKKTVKKSVIEKYGGEEYFGSSSAKEL